MHEKSNEKRGEVKAQAKFQNESCSLILHVPTSNYSFLLGQRAQLGLWTSPFLDVSGGAENDERKKGCHFDKTFYSKFGLSAWLSGAMVWMAADLKGSVVGHWMEAFLAVYIGKADYKHLACIDAGHLLRCRMRYAIVFLLLPMTSHTFVWWEIY